MRESCTILTRVRTRATHGVSTLVRLDEKMNAPTQRTWIFAALLAAVTLNAAPKNDTAKVMFEAARKHEVVDGDLNAAIAQYRSIVSTCQDDRAVVADALIRMGDCYRKLGDTESRKIYEHVVKDFADQKDAVAVARARLGVEPGPLDIR